MSDTLGIEPKVERKPIRKGEIGNFIADTTKLEKSFGQVPNTTVKSGLEKTIEWLRNQ